MLNIILCPYPAMITYLVTWSIHVITNRRGGAILMEELAFNTSLV